MSSNPDILSTAQAHPGDGNLPPGTRVEKSSGWKLYIKTVIARAYPRLIGQQREKSWMFFDIFLPLMGVCAYVFVYRAIKAPEDYIGFVVVGGAMTAFWMNVLWSMSSQLYWEKEQGNLALFIMSPSSMMAILLGMALGGLVATTLRALVIMVLGSVFISVYKFISPVYRSEAVVQLGLKNPVVVSPDVGFAKKARQFAWMRMLACASKVAEMHRPATSRLSIPSGTRQRYGMSWYSLGGRRLSVVPSPVGLWMSIG